MMFDSDVVYVGYSNAELSERATLLERARLCRQWRLQAAREAQAIHLAPMLAEAIRYAAEKAGNLLRQAREVEEKRAAYEQAEMWATHTLVRLCGGEIRMLSRFKGTSWRYSIARVGVSYETIPNPPPAYL